MTNKLALVTGASSGIGFWLAKDLARSGYDLIACSAGDRLANAVEELQASDRKVNAVSADLSTRDGVTELWKQVLEAGRPLDVACINAGIGVGGLFEDTDLDTELKMVKLNCVGVVHLAKLVVRHNASFECGKYPHNLVHRW